MATNINKSENIDDIEMTPVKSSNIAAVGYDADGLRLVVEFGIGSKYIYFGVKQNVYDSFMASESKGRFFHAHIRGKYDTVKTRASRKDRGHG